MKSTHVGFNLLWGFSTHNGKTLPSPDLKLLDFLAEQNFNFLRLPLSYWYWIDNFVYDQPQEGQLKIIDSYVKACTERGFHLSFNVHRAPGYCINGNDREKHNLWLDKKAQDAFTHMWGLFASRYTSYSPEQLSFDLLNEPPNINQYGMTRENHRSIMLRTIKAIRKENRERIITLDGLGGGNLAMPEMADTGCIQSVRGYQPMSITHHGASWCSETQGLGLQDWPGALYENQTWTKKTVREHYKPWRELAATGVSVHVGEMGCYDTIPNETALTWFKDIFDLYREFRWGFALWNFEGNFGVVNHRRPGTRWEKIGPYKVDIDLWNLIIEARDDLRD